LVALELQLHVTTAVDIMHHHRHPLPRSFSVVLDHITIINFPRAVALFPLGKVLWSRIEDITPIMAGLDFVPFM